MIVEATVDVPIPPDVAFDVSQTTGATRLRWDPFIRHQRFLAVMAGGWRFTALPDAGTRAVWRYSFTCRPRWLAPLAERVGCVVLKRDVDRRIGGFARGCADPTVLAAVTDPAV